MDSTAVLTIDEQAGAATRFTDELVRAFGLSADVAAEVVDDDIELRIDGEGASLGVLVGPKGATLQALEELVARRRPARSRRAERPPPPRRRRLSGAPPRGLGRVRRAGRRRGARVRARASARADEPARPEGRARHGRRARRGRDHVGGRGTAPAGRDQARLSGTDTQLPQPGEDALLVVLERARARGYLGPGPVQPHLDHAAASPRPRPARWPASPTASWISAAAVGSPAWCSRRVGPTPG